MVMKECVICGTWFDARNSAKCCSADCMAINKKENDRQYYKDHAEHRKEYRRQYYKDHAEHEKEYKRQYRKDHAEHKKEYDRQYYKDHAEHLKEYSRQYRKDHAEHKKEYDRQYRKDNAEYLKEYRRQKYERVYEELSKLSKIDIDDLKSHIPPMFIQREFDCWGTGSYFLDFIIPVNERADGRCELTGKKSSNLEVHHLNGYNWCIEGRVDPKNAICIDKAVHKAFHDLYGRGNNTLEQWLEFASNFEKQPVTLDDFY